MITLTYNWFLNFMFTSVSCLQFPVLITQNTNLFCCICTPNKIPVTKEDGIVLNNRIPEEKVPCLVCLSLCLYAQRRTVLTLVCTHTAQESILRVRGSLLGVLVSVSVSIEDEDCFVSVHTYSTGIETERRRFPAGCACLYWVSVSIEDEDCFVSVHTYSTGI